MGMIKEKLERIFFISLTVILTSMVTFFCNEMNVNAVAVGTSWDYDYTGEYQTFIAPESTWYKIELWGAMGGRGRTNWTVNKWGGGGAYTGGEIYLEKGTKLYVYVGENGRVGGANKNYCRGGFAGWNGGGTGGNDSNCDGDPEPGGGGGGATDIRLVPTSAPDVWDEFDSLKSRIMVSAGGGGGHYSYNGGAGGRLSGINRTAASWALQTSGYAFGLGIDGAAGSDGKGGGGGGYYGGDASGSGEGGSSFVSGCYGCVAIDKDSTSTNIIHTDSNVHYSGLKFDKIEMYAGILDSQPYWNGGYQVGNFDWGHAKITVAEHRSNNNYLRNITVSNGILSPVFSKTNETYDLTLDSNVSEVVLDAKAEDTKSTIGGLGTYQVKYKETVQANISVTNELGEVRVYKINIKRKELAVGEPSSKLADLNIKTINKGAVVPKLNTTFDSDVLEYQMNVSSTVAALDFDTIPLDTNATITKEGTGKILGDSGTLKITVSAPNCTDTVYQIHYTKDSGTRISNDYSAISEPQEFIAPIHGKYKVQLWGSQGLTIDANYSRGGKGAYTEGDIILDKGEKLYVYVGDNADGNSFNGGGTAAYAKKDRGFGGGGATDVRLIGGSWNDFNSLKSRIMVAAGGSGGERWTGFGSSDGSPAGGLTSYPAAYVEKGTVDYHLMATVATQTSPGFELVGSRKQWSGYRGKFGIGGDGSSLNGAGGAGGGGYFGGGGGGSSSNTITAGTGGSSYISGHTGCNSIAENSSKDFIIPTGSNIHYSKKYFTNTRMIDGLGYEWVDTTGPSYHAHPPATNFNADGYNVELDDGEYTGQPTVDGTGIQEGQEGNGFARIELINDSSNNYLADLKTNVTTQP